MCLIFFHIPNCIRTVPNTKQIQSVCSELCELEGNFYETWNTPTVILDFCFRYQLKSYYTRAAKSGNQPSDMCAQRRFRAACAFAQSDRIFTRCILDSQGCKVSSSWQRRLRSDCAKAQADLSLLCAHIKKVRFLTLRTIQFGLFWMYSNNEQGWNVIPISCVLEFWIQTGLDIK